MLVVKVQPPWKLYLDGTVLLEGFGVSLLSLVLTGGWGGCHIILPMQYCSRNNTKYQAISVFHKHLKKKKFKSQKLLKLNQSKHPKSSEIPKFVVSLLLSSFKMRRFCCFHITISSKFMGLWLGMSNISIKSVCY